MTDDFGSMCTNFQMTQSEKNQYIWDPSAAAISSNVISLEINTGIGNKLPTDNLTDPIKIAVPSAGNQFVFVILSC